MTSRDALYAWLLRRGFRPWKRGSGYTLYRGSPYQCCARWDATDKVALLGDRAVFSARVPTPHALRACVKSPTVWRAVFSAPWHRLRFEGGRLLGLTLHAD